MANALAVLDHYIGGRRVASRTQRFADIHNPATGAVTSRVPLAPTDEVADVVKRAAEALPAWAATPPAKRAEVMFNARALLMAHMDELAALLSTEHGKTIPDAKGEISRGLEVIEFACGIPHLLKGEHSAGVAKGVDSHTLRQPVGVCVGITPFNFPAMVPLWMYPVAIACGNTFVLKPSEKDPTVAVRIAELFSEAGLPDGVFNVVHGDKEAVDALLSDPLVEAVSFVGSTAIGSYIYSQGTAHGKRVQALCGAKNHLVVMPDADMDQVTDALMGAAFGSAGERCMAISVAVAVGDEAADQLVAALKPKIESLKVAPFTDPEAEMGPVVSKESLERIRRYIDNGLAQGAELAVDGRGVSVAGHDEGFFLGGCLFDRVTTDMDIYRDEIFGPVLCLVRAPDYETALKMVNDHEYGNGAAIFTRDGDAAHDFTTRVKAGMVGVNVPIPVPVAYHSFGGWKRSLFGDHHIHGMEGVRFYTRLKTMTTRWPSGIRQGAEFHFKRGSEIT
jgi:malonate-semialdehyde dehydrogenase (acetylating)/methylmalonate-semialdehyde dehydrogenase